MFSPVQEMKVEKLQFKYHGNGETVFSVVHEQPPKYSTVVCCVIATTVQIGLDQNEISTTEHQLRQALCTRELESEKLAAASRSRIDFLSN